MRISVVIPCYRSAQILPQLVERLTDVIGTISEEYEVILVVDGSPDESWNVARELSETYPRVEAINLSRNYGQHNAILAGIRSARFETIVTMDDDLQHLPEEIPSLVAALTPELDLVYGSPLDEEHGFLRSLASRTVKSLMARGLGIKSAKDISAFRAFRTSLRDGLVGMEGPHASIDVALSWATTRVGSTKVRMEERAEGRSNYSFRLLLRHAVNMLLGYSTAPLRLVGYLGFFCGAVGAVMLAIVLWQYFIGDTTIQGFTTLASMVAIFSGAQMIAIGVLGEYLARVHSQNMGKPTYVIRESTLVSAS